MEQAQKRREERELRDRLTAPQHVTFSSFREHRKIEGYFENRNVPEFMGSDRLMKLDSLYGTIQLGYNPRKGMSFLFANLKTSVYDTAASRYQREMRDNELFAARRSGTQNYAFVSRRRAGSSVVLYKEENKPWSLGSIAPYLRRLNFDTLRRTMPFLESARERAERADIRGARRALQDRLAGALRERKTERMAALRAEDTALLHRADTLGATLARKDTAARLFFRKINYAFDIQKHEMFDYYRQRRLRAARQGPEPETGPQRPPDRDEDEDEDA